MKKTYPDHNKAVRSNAASRAKQELSHIHNDEYQDLYYKWKKILEQEKREAAMKEIWV